jgi:hypothetical protein
VVTQTSYVKVETAIPDKTNSDSTFLRERAHLESPGVDRKTNKIMYQRNVKERCWLNSADTGISAKLVWTRYQIIGCHKRVENIYIILGLQLLTKPFTLTYSMEMNPS